MFFPSFHEQTIFFPQVAEQTIYFPKFAEQSFFHKKTIAPPPGIKWSAPRLLLVKAAVTKIILVTSHWVLGFYVVVHLIFMAVGGDNPSDTSLQ